jgi:hypothetical protein
MIRKIGLYCHSIGGRELACSMIGIIGKRRRDPKSRTKWRNRVLCQRLES